MIRKKSTLCVFLIAMSSYNVFAQKNQNKQEEVKKMEWFEDAKLGVFIHWGIYSVKGISESWAFFNNYISHENYMKQLNGFTASQYQPEEWANLIHESGAQYSVITTRHHDGISLWDSKANNAITTTKDAAAKKDVLTPFIAALQKTGLRTGLYYSLPDWSHPDYDVNTRTKKRYVVTDDTKRWSRFVNYYQGQLEELSKAYKPDLIWFDGDWEHNDQEWHASETLTKLRRYNPNIIINSRLNHHGDYETPEQGIPVVRPEAKYWELCYTMNDSWGYQPFDQHYKSPNMIVRTLVDCIAMGGNLLVDIGPREDGTIPEQQVQILKELGRWTSKYKEGIYGTRAGIASKFLTDKNAFSKDGKTLYVYMDNIKDKLVLTGLYTKPTSVRFVGNKEKINVKYDGYTLNLNLPTDNFDPAVTVVAITFAEKPDFRLDRKETIPTATSIAKESKLDAAIAEISKYTAQGSNLFQDKISLDGDILDTNLQFSSKELKDWVTKNAEVLHDAQAGIVEGHYAGLSALSKDNQTLYLFVEGTPTGPIAVKGLKNTIARIRIVGEGSMIGHDIFNKLYWSATPGIVYIDVPKERLDKKMTVIAVLLDKPIELYREKVGAIESNL
ncbi:alpha-L-fucosidase [Sphingobacterium sp. SRCM116780]|uniref:alpha-L-fucosidase n=1 Tax=Sphingobacterium sp. SRCM116780 TaxID=2907623 RepID=UPI001F2FC3E8|nr:alpha-L-fucosidase [Sphingobacterium sp. SRCM116780]UIR57514.1 alpha-L-fucosidase [Sphingobacterium sp. SRCM116780]